MISSQCCQYYRLNHDPIRGFGDFVNALLEAGFSLGGGNSSGIFALIPWSWNEEPPYETPVRWHTGDPETDPWEWRMRVLEERNDIAYGKFFFSKGGFITKKWAPYFIAARRGNTTLEKEYEEGHISNPARRIYNTVLDYGTLPLHVIKEFAGFGRDEKSKFDNALIELQMKMYLTMCGRQPKISAKGEEYGWSSTVFCTTEDFWGSEVFEEADKLNRDDAIAEITERVLALNPCAKPRRIIKFITG